jgi:hypothetical protein
MPAQNPPKNTFIFQRIQTAEANILPPPPKFLPGRWFLIHIHTFLVPALHREKIPENSHPKEEKTAQAQKQKANHPHIRSRKHWLGSKGG